MTQADKDTQRAYLEALVVWFNRKFPIGKKCQVRRDNNTIVQTEVSVSAMVFYSDSAVAWFKDISGFYSIEDHPDGGWRVREIPE